MSRIHTGKNSFGRNTYTTQPFFKIIRAQSGGLRNCGFNLNFGASWASAILGPDIYANQATNNQPSIGGFPWDNTRQPSPNLGYPQITFSQDQNFTWIRGHLINGRWGGPGNSWQNLTPLTATANSNHAAIEALMDNYMWMSSRYDSANPYKDHWFGVDYSVVCSQEPFADQTNYTQNNLYSYAPAAIRVSWRAIAIEKPLHSAVPTGSILNYLHTNAGLVINPVQQLPFSINQTIPSAVGNYQFGGVLQSIQNNGFDGDAIIENR
ncbi:hypothetical protein JYU12_01765 [bacterium AH-315-K03]|nr:hypothetical protein [bacterium AH-315-K03]